MEIEAAKYILKTTKDCLENNNEVSWKVILTEAIDTVIAELNKQEKLIKHKNNRLHKNIKRKVGGRR